MKELPDIFYEMFRPLPRQGPGDDALTRKAWSFLSDLPPKPAILDIGCGCGMQTLELARLSSGKVVALDNYQPLLDRLQEQAKQAGLDKHIEVVNGSMFALDFAPQSFDVIWSEGAIYIIGFVQGLAACKPLIKPGGYMVVSDMAWFVPDPPDALCQFLDAEGISLVPVDEVLQQIEQAGYRCITSFQVPESAWWENFYTPLEEHIAQLRQKYAGDAEAQAVLDSGQKEIDFYRMYASSYGYMFYVMQPVDA